MTLHAFVDESIRGQNYIICAAIIDAQDLFAAQQTMRSLLTPGQRRIHFNNERDSRRDQILKEIATINVGCIICTAHDSSQDAARALALSDVVTRLLGRGVVHLVLETRQGQDHRDRVVIGETVARAGIKRRFTYHHQAPVGEPMLWVPDAVAWAWGRDSVWQQLVKRLQLVNDA